MTAFRSGPNRHLTYVLSVVCMAFQRCPLCVAVYLTTLAKGPPYRIGSTTEQAVPHGLHLDHSSESTTFSALVGKSLSFGHHKRDVAFITSKIHIKSRCDWQELQRPSLRFVGAPHTIQLYLSLALLYRRLHVVQRSGAAPKNLTFNGCPLAALHPHVSSSAVAIICA